MTDTNQEVREPTATQIEAAAKVIWTDFSARYGGPWEDVPEEAIAAIQTRATAKAALAAALASAPPPAVPDAVGVRASTNEQTTPWEAVKTALAAFDKPYEYLSDDKAMRLAIAVVDATRAALSSIEPILPPPVRDPDSDDWRTLASGETDLDRLIKLCGILDAADHRPPFKTRTRAALREMASHLKRLQDLSSPSEPTPSPEPQAAEALADMERRKDAAYEERNKVVAALAKLFPSGICKTDIPGWSDDWHGCVRIDLPTGQVSWHYHDSQAHLFADLPPYQGEWDGHDTQEKYRRLAALSPEPQASNAGAVRSTAELCDCELGHNGFGIAGRECDCPTALSTSKNQAALPLTWTRNDLAEGLAASNGERLSNEWLEKADDLLAHLSFCASTPEPQTGERDGEVVDPAVVIYWWDKDRSVLEPLVRQSALLAERTARKAAERSLAEVEERARENAARLDWMEANPGAELAMVGGWDEEDDCRWAVHIVRGGRNDREWNEIASGATARAALDAALRAKPEAQAIVGKEAQS